MTGKPDVPSPWGHKELDVTGQLNIYVYVYICYTHTQTISHR